MSEQILTDENTAVEKEPGRFREMLHQLKKNKGAIAGLIIIALFLLVGIFALVLTSLVLRDFEFCADSKLETS